MITEIHKFIELTAEEGMMLTTYTFDQDIMDYDSTKMVYVPTELEAALWYEITEEQDEDFRQQQAYAATSGITTSEITEEVSE